MLDNQLLMFQVQLEIMILLRQNKDDLKIVKITADKSSSVKRYRAKARGRAGAFDRPTSHLVIEVDEEGI